MKHVASLARGTCLAVALLAAGAHAQLTVSTSTWEGGGIVVSGGTFELRGTAGTHTGTSGLSGGTIEHDAGHWPGICGSTIVPYGAGCPGSGGFSPVLAFGGCFGPGDLTTITVSQGLGGSQAFLALGFSQTALPFGAGCVLYTPLTIPLIGPLPLFGAGAGAGFVSFPLVIPPDLSYAWGLSVYWQVFALDPGSAKGFTVSNGVRTTIG